MENNDGTWRIECVCIIYRALHGMHPDWAKPTGDASEDGIKSMMKAVTRAEELETQYGELVRNCENTGDWTDFPFKDKEIIYYK